VQRQMQRQFLCAENLSLQLFLQKFLHAGATP